MSTTDHADKRQAIIDKIDVYWGQIPVNCHFSYGECRHFDFIFVSVQSGSSIGWGEILATIDDEFLGKAAQFVDLNARSLDDIVAGIFANSPYNRGEAFSIALHDLIGKIDLVPLHTFFGTAQRFQVPLMPCIFKEKPEDAAASAKFFLDQGIKHLKVKLFGNRSRDLETIRQIRNMAGNTIYLQADANNGYPFDVLKNGLLKSFKSNGLNVIEDPCEASVEQFTQLRHSDHPLIMIDFLARDDHRLKQMLVGKATDMVNLHPCQQGLLSHAVYRARLCADYGVPAMVGGTGFLGIGTAAYQHLSTVIGLSGPCGTLGGAFDHGMPHVVKNTIAISKGMAVISDKPGHGIELDMIAIQPYLKGHQTFNRKKQNLVFIDQPATSLKQHRKTQIAVPK